MFEDNVLNRFNSYTYNIELVLYPASVGSKSKADLPGGGVIVAKTGKSANYYIERLEMDSIFLNVQNNSKTTTHSMSMDISEPMGFTFLDRYLYACKMMGWQNPKNARVYLAVSFNGWDVNGAPIAEINKSAWQCEIVTIETALEVSGSKYKLQILPIESIALADDHRVIPRQKRFEVKDTLEATVSEMSNALTDIFSKNQTAKNAPQNYSMEHVIQLSNRLKERAFKMPITVSTGTDTTPTAADAKHYNVLQSTERIENAIIKTVADSIGIAFDMIPNLKSDGTVDVMAMPSAIFPKMFIIHKDVELTSFDPVRNNYNKKITHTVDYHIRPDVQIAPPGTTENYATAYGYLSQGLMKKRYDYMFTGKNTEVIDLDLDFNLLWEQLTSTYANNPLGQTPSTSEEYRNVEDQATNKRLLVGNIPDGSGGITVPNSIVGNNVLMEELPVSSSFADFINVNIGPTALPEILRNGVGTNVNPEQASQKIAIADSMARAHGQKTWQQNAFMVNLKLTIRGDPFWFGTPNIQENPMDVESNPSNYANTSNGTNYLFLKFAMPETYDVDSGLINDLGRLTYTGIYQLTQLKSIFESGKFTQELTGGLDVKTIGVDFPDGNVTAPVSSSSPVPVPKPSTTPIPRPNPNLVRTPRRPPGIV